MGSSDIPIWLQSVSAAAPIATLAAALIAGAIAWRALKQRERADARDQWWQRAQWAMDLAIHGSMPAKSVAVSALNQLAKSDLLGPEEESFLLSVADDLESIVVDTWETAEETDYEKDEGSSGDTENLEQVNEQP